MEKAAIIKPRFIPLYIPLRDWKPNFLKAPGREEVALAAVIQWPWQCRRRKRVHEIGCESAWSLSGGSSCLLTSDFCLLISIKDCSLTQQVKRFSVRLTRVRSSIG